MTTPSLVLCPSRAEGAGTGHIARCHALAESWTATGGAAVVWAPALPSPWAERFDSIGVDVIDTRPASGSDWAVLDGYEFTIADHHKCAPSQSGCW